MILSEMFAETATAEEQQHCVEECLVDGDGSGLWPEIFDGQCKNRQQQSFNDLSQDDG